ncbi:hypothetical protein BIU82_14035 [Arthrobacter sp. SW1]|nr:hypothetical protein BIU82_14035 [Arthrobacter sp. SW1]
MLSGIAVLGATGFIGRRIAAALADTGKARVALLSRNPSHRQPGDPAWLQGRHADKAMVDITVPGSLLSALEGAGLPGVVVHAVSYVGPDPVLARQVNEEGTRHVIEQCRRAGNPRLIYLSTASVHGMGPHRGGGPRPYRPASAASAARAAAERMVLDYGGEVVRPNLVLGDGDRWVAPGLFKILDAAGGWPGDGTARLSVIDAGSLGALVAGLALAGPQPGKAFYAAFPEPVPVRRLIEGLCREAGRPRPQMLGDVPEAWEALWDAGFSRHQIDLVTVDHYYPSERLWRISGVAPETVPETVIFRS